MYITEENIMKDLIHSLDIKYLERARRKKNAHQRRYLNLFFMEEEEEGEKEGGRLLSLEAISVIIPL